MTISDTLPVLWLRKQADRRLRAGHLWIFSNEVDIQRSPLKTIQPGAQMQVCSASDRLLGTVYVNPNSLISARLFPGSDGSAISSDFIFKRMKQAHALRSGLYAQPWYRLIFGESDGLPGLIIDRYGEVMVVQLNTAGMEALQAQVANALQVLLGPCAIVWRNDSSARVLEGLDQHVTVQGEVPDEILLNEHGCRFTCSLTTGHKTGWYFDQSDNRAALVPYIQGGRVLDVFSYLGGWGIQAAKAGAASVTCIEGSARLCANIRRNADLNETPVTILCEDAFKALAHLRDQNARFDLIVLDPPALISRKRDFAHGKEAYRRLNYLAMRLLEPGGFLITGSCSYHMPRDTLASLLRVTASSLNLRLQILETRGQGRDHPVDPAVAETEYLKMFYCRLLA